MNRNCKTTWNTWSLTVCKLSLLTFLFLDGGMDVSIACNMRRGNASRKNTWKKKKKKKKGTILETMTYFKWNSNLKKRPWVHLSLTFTVLIIDKHMAKRLTHKAEQLFYPGAYSHYYTIRFRTKRCFIRRINTTHRFVRKRLIREP